MKKTFVIFTLGLSAFLVSCGGGNTEPTSGTIVEKLEETSGEIRTESNTAPNAPKTEVQTEGIVEESQSTDEEIIAFLPSIDGTFGWVTADENDISYDFFPTNNGLHIQGPDGEATMWQGTWSVSEGKVRIVCKDRNQDEQLVVKIDGEKLVLGDKTYTRYSPDLSE